jgi:hypothetical protein
MGEVRKYREPLVDDPATLAPLYVGDEPDPARIMVETCVIEAPVTVPFEVFSFHVPSHLSHQPIARVEFQNSRLCEGMRLHRLETRKSTPRYDSARRSLDLRSPSKPMNQRIGA